jgi:hypothetical protein
MLLEIPDTLTLPEARHWLDIRRARRHGDYIYTPDCCFQWNQRRRIFERVAHLPDATAVTPVVAPPPAPRSRFWAGVRKGLLWGFVLGWLDRPRGGHCHHGYDSNY